MFEGRTNASLFERGGVRREEQPVDVPRMAGWVELSYKLTRVKRVDK